MSLSVVNVSYTGELITRGKLVHRVNKWPWQSDEQGTYEVVSDFWITVDFFDPDLDEEGNAPHGRFDIYIPAGFTTDMASTPMLLRSVFPQSMPGRNVAFVGHDKLYSDSTVTCRGNAGAVTRYLDRKTCDRIMKAILIDKNTISWKVSSIYSAVRAWGWRTWDKYRENSTGTDNAPT